MRMIVDELRNQYPRNAPKIYLSESVGACVVSEPTETGANSVQLQNQTKR